MPELEPLRADHAPALLAFERENRAYFAAWISDRGDAYFEQFAERHRELLAWQEAGTDFLHVLVEEDGSIVGRVNLFEVSDGLFEAAGGCANLGFRVAQRVAGQGIATAAVRQVCGLAGTEYGLAELRAAASTENLGSQTVLTRTGFIRTGELVLPSGQPGIGYRLDLT